MPVAGGPPPPPGFTPPAPSTGGGGSGPNTGLIIGIVVAALAVLGVGAFFLFRSDDGEAEPDETLPVLTLPETVPDITIPDFTIPDITIPDLTFPDITVPDFTIPDITIPDITIPDFSIPDITIPDFSIPDFTGVPGEIPPPTQEPVGLGDNEEFDELAQDCYDGDMQACDDLYQQSEVDSDYETYGDTCAGRQPAGTLILCTVTFPG